VSDSADLAMATYCSSTESSIMPACLLVPMRMLAL
jgi:hypothetical protein